VSRNDRDVVIVSACRTPIGKFGGVFKEVRAYQLAGFVMEEAIKRAGIQKDRLDEVIAGDGLQCVDEANTARVAALGIGIPPEVPAFTVQRQCSSAMQALVCARQEIVAGDADVILAVGTESQSSAPYILKTARWGQRLMHGEMTDSLWEILLSGSGLVGEKMLMGETAERVADLYGVSREAQDEVALRSHQNAEAAIKAGRFKEEIVPVPVRARKGETTLVAQDEHPRFGLTMEDLVKLQPAFRPDGTVTAGNSSGLNDGAAAVIVMSRARATELGVTPLACIRATSAAGVAPEVMGIGPIPATQKILQRANLALDAIGLIEMNEAFASQYLACERELDIDRERTNVNGSGIGLGHPAGATGIRLVVTLLHEMRRRGEQYGLATLCVGGGMGLATLLELEA
jgi:acetyl-CoA C-acetyltransferase